MVASAPTPRQMPWSRSNARCRLVNRSMGGALTQVWVNGLYRPCCCTAAPGARPEGGCWSTYLGCRAAAVVEDV
jgi:hypothetical protein